MTNGQTIFFDHSMYTMPLNHDGAFDDDSFPRLKKIKQEIELDDNGSIPTDQNDSLNESDQLDSDFDYLTLLNGGKFES